MLKAYRNRVRTGQTISEFGNKVIPSLDQLNLNQSNTVNSTNLSPRRLQLYSIDISELLESLSVSWLTKPMNQPLINSGPPELIKYSLAVGNSEMIIFGGINPPHPEKQVELGQDRSVASNRVHFISALRYII